MLICFGASWPFAIARTYKTKSAKSKSFIFLTLLLLGYSCGMINKLVAPEFQWVFFCYMLNFIMVAIEFGLCICYRMREERIGFNLSKN